MVATCNWTGASGQKYTYEVYEFGTPFNEVPGNYAITKRDPQLRHTILYFGESDNLKQRCCGGHEKWEAAIRLGATHIQAHRGSPDKTVRCGEESDLVANYNPPLNK